MFATVILEGKNIEYIGHLACSDMGQVASSVYPRSPQIVLSNWRVTPKYARRSSVQPKIFLSVNRNSLRVIVKQGREGVVTWTVRAGSWIGGGRQSKMGHMASDRMCYLADVLDSGEP